MSKQPASPLWEIVSRRPIFSVPGRIDIFEERVKLPDGREIGDYYQTVEPAFAIVYAETDRGHVLALRHYRHGPRRVVLSLPGGMLDPGEPPLAAAQRELWEETGYRATSWLPLGSFCTNSNQGGATAHAFLCRGAVQTAQPGGQDLEATVVETLTHDQLRNALKSGMFAVAGDLAVLALARNF